LIYFSDKIDKINEHGSSQERQILVTNKALYNLDSKDLKRKIEVKLIKGVTVSSQNDEFVVHCNNEYDYYYISSKKKRIIEALLKGYQEITKQVFGLCLIDAKSLKNFVTTKADKKSNPNFSKMPEMGTMDINVYLYGQRKGSVDNQIIISNHQYIKDVKLSDFQIVKVLGRGSYGKVCLVEYKPRKEVYAMKGLKKDVLIDQDQIKNVILEKKILESLQHEFLVGLVCCFQTKERIFLVLPFLRGGELFIHLRKNKIFDENRARFYGAQIALALDHLHKLGIIYRDLKPENILMDESGYLKITDFGMAKIVKKNEKATTFCGTPEYIAPEVITEEGHDHTADWWSFGILMYEMLHGMPPFYSDNLEKMYELIQKGDIKFNKRLNISEEAKDLILKFLSRNPKKRLGINGINEIKSHPFFAKIDFDQLLKRKIQAPFIPDIKDKYDVNNFDKEFTGESTDQSDIPSQNLELIIKNQDLFKEFFN